MTQMKQPQQCFVFILTIQWETSSLSVLHAACLLHWLQESRWNFLFAFLAFPALLQLCVLPFLPESPRYLLIEKRDEDGAKKGTVSVTRVCIGGHVQSTLVLYWFKTGVPNCFSKVMRFSGQFVASLYKEGCVWRVCVSQYFCQSPGENYFLVTLLIFLISSTLMTINNYVKMQHL